MRSEQQMIDLILNTAREDERIRAVLLNGSRANPGCRRDPFQDFDVVYIVTDMASFTSNHGWISRFGELMILQLPDEMGEPEVRADGGFAYLMQFADGNRIDLSLIPLADLDQMEPDSLTVLLLDKDNRFNPLPPPSESGYLPKPPTAKEFSDCCNEFWWVSPYAAKGLWRDQITYAKSMLDSVIREQLMKMLAWYVGIRTDFSKNPGYCGKHLQEYLEPELWEELLRTYADADRDRNWEALFEMGNLFRKVALGVAEPFGYEYPQCDDERVCSYLKTIHTLPQDAVE